MPDSVSTLERDAAPVQTKSLLRFLTCGSVDDGKSTLIGRLLYDTKLIFEDTLATLERDSTKYGTTGEAGNRFNHEGHEVHEELRAFFVSFVNFVVR